MRITWDQVRAWRLRRQLLASARSWERPSWQRNFGATPREIDALADAVSALLDGEVLTREELVTRLVAKPGFAAMEVQLRSGWGALLKPLAWRGVLRHGPGRGTRITFARPPWHRLPDPEEAAPLAIAAYLGAYGPATPDAFGAWLLRGALGRTALRRWFAAMDNRLATVDVEGHAAHVLAEHVLGPGTGDPQTVPPRHRAEVSRTAGWIAPVVVVADRVAGTWEEVKGEVRVSMFDGAAPPPGLGAEVARVSAALARE